jgi:uncharacterized protein (TIGR02246 family)
MKYLTSLILLSSIAAACSVSAQTQRNRAEDEAEIRRIVQAFIDTREGDDRDALEALLSSDADQLVTTGNMRTGVAAVVDGSLTTTQSAGGRRIIEIRTIRFLTDDVAIGDGPYNVVDRPNGPDRHYLTTIVFRREAGGWKIAAIRNMQPRE